MNIRINKEKILDYCSLAFLSLANFAFLFRQFFGMSRTYSFYDFTMNLRFLCLCGLLVIVIFKIIFRKFNRISLVLALLAIIYVALLTIYKEHALFIDKSFKLDVLIYVIAIIACKDINYRTVILTVLLSSLIFNIYNLYKVLLNDLINGVALRGNSIRYQLGRANGGEFSVITFYILLYYCYIRNNKMSNAEKILLVLLCFVMYYLTNTKLPFLLSIMALLLILNIDKLSTILTNKYFTIAIALFIVIAPLVILYLSVDYDPNVEFYTLANKLLSNRLSLVNNAYYEFGVGLFSKEIMYTMQPGLYNVIDSSFMIMLIEYGVIMYAIFIVFLLYFLFLIYKNRDACLMIIFAISLIDMLFNNTLTYFQYNLLLFVLSYRNTMILNSKC